MKLSIVITLIMTIAAFSYVSGYSISAHNKRGDLLASKTQATASTKATVRAIENDKAASGGYGTPSPGYGQ